MITKQSFKEFGSQAAGIFRNNVEAAPIPSFFIGVITGALIILLRAYLYPLAVIAIIAAGGIMLFADDGTKGGSDPTSSHRAPDQAS